jgi:hypothetical protein
VENLFALLRQTFVECSDESKWQLDWQWDQTLCSNILAYHRHWRMTTSSHNILFWWALYDYWK